MAFSRNIVIGLDPETGLGSTYSWDIAPDLNGEGKQLSCAYIPRNKGDAINALQEAMFLAGYGCNKMYQTFRNDLARDDGVDFEAEWITANLDPTLGNVGTSDTKRYVKVEYPTVNPPALGITVEFCKDTHNPHSEPATWRQFDFTPGNSRQQFQNGLAQWINIRGRKTTAIPPTRIIWAAFILHFYRLFTREARDS